MAGPLSWSFTLLDKMSGPADDIAKSLAAANKAMQNAKPAGDAISASVLKTAVAEAKAATETRRLAKELEGYTKQLQPTKKLTIEMGNLVHSFAGFRMEAGKGAIFNVAEGVQAAIGLVERLAGGFLDLTAKALDTAAAGEKTKRAFDLNLGAGSKELLTYLDQVAAKSRGLYTQAQLRELAAPLARHGIGIEDTKKFLPAALSVEQRGGSASGAIEALGNIRTNRSIDAGTLESLGLGSLKDKKDIAAKLGKMFGIGKGFAAMNPEGTLSVISEQLKYRPQKAGAVVQTLLKALEKREGGALGNEAEGGSHGTAATMARLSNLPTTIMERMTASGQLNGLVSALDHFTDVLTGPKGKAFIDGFATIVDKLAFIIDRVAGFMSTDTDAEKIRKKGGLAFEDRAGNVTDSVSSMERAALVKRALGPGYQGNITDISEERQRQLATDQYGKEYRQKQKDIANAGVGTVLAPSESKDIGFGIADAMFERQQSLTGPVGGMPAPSASADDFIWRDGRAIEIDPRDNVVGFKSGGSLGIGGGSGGGGMTLQIAPGAIRIDGAGKNASEIADEVMDRIKDGGAAAILLSALEQFGAEQAA